MNELYYKIASDIYCMAKQAITGLGFSMLYRIFFGKAKRTWLVGGAYFAVTAVLYYVPFPVDNFAVYVSAIFTAFLVMLACGRGGGRMKIFLAVTYFAVRWFAVTIVADIAILLSDYSVRRICEADISDDWKYRLLFASFCWHNVLECIVLGLIFWGIVCGIGRAFSDKESDLQSGELCVLLIPSVLGVVFYKIHLMYDNAFWQETQMYVSDNYPALSVMWAFGKIILLAAIICMIVLYQRLKEKQTQEKNAALLAGQIQDMQSHIAQIEHLYTEIRGVKHDVRSHVGVMAGLLGQENYAEAARYLQRWQETVAALDFTVQTGDPVTDVILNEKAAEAAAKQIEFSSDFRYPAGTQIDAFDLSILLNNAISNAIKAAEAGGYVHVGTKRNGNACLIEISNSFAGKLVIGENGLPVSGSSNGSGHGFGVQNMRLIAQKYFGDIEIEQRDGEVTVTALLMCE